MSPSDLSRSAARALAEDDPGPLDANETARQLAVEALRRELRAKARRRVVTHRLLPVLAAAVVVLVGMTFWKGGRGRRAESAPPRSGTVVAEHVVGDVRIEGAGSSARVLDHVVLTAEGTVSTNEGSAVFAFPSSARLDVTAASKLRMGVDGGLEFVELEQGGVVAHVTKRREQERFVVRAHGIEVEVRGTVFRVSRRVDPTCGERTRVSVDEGRVEVRSLAGITVLASSDTWTEPCADDLAGASDAAAPPNAVAVDAGGHGSSAISTIIEPTGTARRPRVPSDDTTSLAAQNALFDEAVREAAHGRNEKAAALLDELVTKYPHSPLREAADARRMAALSSFDEARARDAAKRYLERYPRGFARKDAERILRP